MPTPAGCAAPERNVRAETLGTPNCLATQESLVSVRVARGLVEAVEYAGGSRDAFLTASRLDRAQLDSAEACLRRSELYEMFQLALDLSHDPALGLHWCERLSESVFNPISQLITNAATLREGLNTLTRFRGLLSDPPGYELLETKDKVTVYCATLAEEPLRLRRFVSEMLVAGFIRLLRTFSPHARPDWVGFAYPAPDYRPEYLRMLGGDVQFDQPTTGLVFDAALLDLPSPHRDADVHSALHRIAERRILQVQHKLPFSWRVRDYLVKRGANHPADMPAVARALGMSPRSLRRRLNEEGASFSDLAHEANASIAAHLLVDKRWTIQETAYEMGYAHPTTFQRAFKRWTGKTPKGFRDQRGGTR